VSATLEPSAQQDIASVRPGKTASYPRPRRRVFGRFIRLTSAAVVLGSLAFAIFSPMRFQFPVNTYATITPAQKWLLVKGTNGQLIARTFNYQTGMSDGYRVANFTTGSSISFTVDPSLTLGRHVAVGDTVGWISSSEMQERLVVLSGQLAAAQHVLAVSATGQKDAVVGEAEQRLRAAQRQRDEYQTTVTRTQALFDRKLIAAGDYENVQSNAHKLEDDVSIASAALEAARTGAKPEQLALAESNIAALKNEISAINSRAATFTLRAPIAGVVTPTPSGDTLLTIGSTSEFVAMVPIPFSDYPRVAAERRPLLNIPGYSRPVRGRVVAIHHEIEVLFGHRVVLATAVLDSPPDDLLPGSIVRCSVECGPLTMREYGTLVFRNAATGAAAGSY